MAGRRDFLKRFGIGIAAAPVAVQVAEAAMALPAKVASAPVPEPPKRYDPESFRNFYGMPTNGAITSSVCMSFNVPYVHIRPNPLYDRRSQS